MAQHQSSHLPKRALVSQLGHRTPSVYLVQRKARPSLHIGEFKFKVSFTEPVGGSSPKFTLKSTVSALEALSGNPFELSCPAQGAPIPSFRFSPSIYSPLPEPVGGSLPKFTLKRDGERRDVLLGSPFELSCPAQGSPIPSFRLVTFPQPLPHFQSQSEARLQSSPLTQKLLGLSVEFTAHSV